MGVATGDQAKAKLFTISTVAQQQVSVGSLKPQDANTAWAFATFVHADAKLLATWAVAEQRTGEFKQQEFANTAWAFAAAHQAGT